MHAQSRNGSYALLSDAGLGHDLTSNSSGDGDGRPTHRNWGLLPVQDWFALCTSSILEQDLPLPATLQCRNPAEPIRSYGVAAGQSVAVDSAAGKPWLPQAELASSGHPGILRQSPPPQAPAVRRWHHACRCASGGTMAGWDHARKGRGHGASGRHHGSMGPCPEEAGPRRVGAPPWLDGTMREKDGAGTGQGTAG